MPTSRICGGLWLLVILLLSAAVLTSCVKKPVVVLGDSRTVKLQAGQPAPVDGWLLTDSAMAELLECCSDNLDAE